jgi:hypothetical protein
MVPQVGIEPWRSARNGAFEMGEIRHSEQIANCQLRIANLLANQK